jgi:heat-inducible transcriptional repressor
MELSERKKQILKSIIDAYILSGEPVGSKYVAKKMKLAVSSATIRNEMSELEQYGLLERQAGFLPTKDTGFMWIV